jgi:uncharacterized small protein (DUF1192 family)
MIERLKKEIEELKSQINKKEESWGIK